MRTFSFAVVVFAALAWATSVTSASYSGSSAVPSGGAAGVAVSPTTQTTMAVQVGGGTVSGISLLAWCYSGSAWGRLPAYDLQLSGRTASEPTFLTSAPLNIPPNCSRVYWQTESVRPTGASHTVQVSLLNDSGPAACDSLVTRAVSCGTTSATVPSSRTASSTSLEIVNSPENAGSPKVKCIANPSDGGVGFGGTNPGLVRSPGESILFSLDDTHTVICVCDTPGTALTTTECVP